MKSVLWSVQIWHSCWWSRERRSSIQFKSQHLWWYKNAYGHKQLACFGRNYAFWKVSKGFKATNTSLQKTFKLQKRMPLRPRHLRTFKKEEMLQHSKHRYLYYIVNKILACVIWTSFSFLLFYLKKSSNFFAIGVAVFCIFIVV